MTKVKLLTINVRGLAMHNKFVDFCRIVSAWARDSEVHGVCVQEHNLDPKSKSVLMRVAADFRLHLVIGFSSSPAHRGGCLILTDEATLPHIKNLQERPSVVRAKYDFNGQTLDIASVYAPSKGTLRIDFFNRLKGWLSPQTIVGGDWNCVPDVLLDLKGRNQLLYPNIGGELLNKVMAELTLNDYRRDQLEGEFEHTRKSDYDSTTIMSRLDRWYLPTHSDFADYLWDIHVRNDLVWSPTGSDHQPVLLTIEPAVGEKGRERPSIREDIIFEARVQARIINLTEEAYQGSKSKVKKWAKAMNMIKDYLLAETAKLKKKEREETKQVRQELCVLNARMNAEGAANADKVSERSLKERLFTLLHPEAPHLANAARAKSMTDRSEACTLPFFKTYKDIGKQSWINEINAATWIEGAEPVVSGTEKRPAAIAGELAKYYKMLFSEKEIVEADKRELVQKLGKVAIQSASAEAMEAVIEDEEVRDVMDHLPLGKQAGPNRVPNAVFRCMSKYFAPKLAKILRDVMSGKCSLPSHMLEGDITILYKKKSRLDPRNYRPLTMLNTDYKVYTKILANRLKTVVHEFVSSMQKGFVPDVFIAECTMALNLIENHINERPTERKGAFIFLDMEKAFDRVSYSYLTESLEALGFGPRFRRAVGAMYNTEAPPKRRVLANGYYSPWFQIKSGVAQGCPLSPLLFLVVAEGLKISLDMQRGFEGIRVGGKYYKLSQFADDTTLVLGDLGQLAHAEEGILRWCRATGMRENKSKREGLAMGMYREQNLPPDIDWKGEGEWATCLGVPIGNDLNAEKWWMKKLEEVRAKARKWTGLFRTGYFGRNLVVQAMFLGRLRYWLYSVPMSRKVAALVQNDADILWWSKEPVLGGEAKRFRRFVARKTAIGPRVMGGLGNVDWAAHVDGFMSQWITRYVDPATSQWKELLDSMLLHDKNGQSNFPEERGVFYSKLTRGDRYRLLSTLPKRAHYIKECIRAHFRLNLTFKIDPEELPPSLPAEPLWRNHRFGLAADRRRVQYYHRQLGLRQLVDLIHPRTRRVRTADQWLTLINRRAPPEREWRGHRADHAEWSWGDDAVSDSAVRAANELHRLVCTIPTGIRAWLEVFMAPVEPEYDELRNMGSDLYGFAIGADRYQMQRVNAVGKLVDLGYVATYTASETFAVSRWSVDKTDYFGEGELETRIRGPAHRVFPDAEGWMLDSEEIRIDLLSIRLRTRALAVRKMHTPAAQKAWAEPQRLPMRIPWHRVWRIKSFYASPRDQLTWLKVMHRNLYLAGSSNEEDKSCRVCPEKENIVHLVRCKRIRREFWDNIALVMDSMGFEVPRGGLEGDAFWLVGRMNSGGAVGPEQAGMIFIAWRCLYAEIVHSRVEGQQMNIGRALNRVWQMTITRLRAEGEKWRKWHKVNVGSGKRSYFPKKYQDRKVIRFNDQAEYTIASDILLAYEESLRKIRGDRGGGPSTQSGATPQQVVRTEAKRGRVEDRQQGGQATKAARIQHQPVPFRGTGPTTQTVMDHFMAT